jgi:hypothetical protein
MSTKCWSENLEGKFRFIWEDMHLIEIGWGDAKWIRMAQNRVQWRAVVNANEPSGTIKARNFLSN